RSAHRFDHRPVGVLFTVLASLMRPQEHLGPSLSPALVGRKRVSLHYIVVWENRDSKDRTCSISNVKIHANSTASDELRLAQTAGGIGGGRHGGGVTTVRCVGR